MKKLLLSVVAAVALATPALAADMKVKAVPPPDHRRVTLDRRLPAVARNARTDGVRVDQRQRKNHLSAAHCGVSAAGCGKCL